jgi:hypothetical protein
VVDKILRNEISMKIDDTKLFMTEIKIRKDSFQNNKKMSKTEQNETYFRVKVKYLIEVCFYTREKRNVDIPR